MLFQHDITWIPEACGSVTCTLGEDHTAGGGRPLPHWLLSGDPLYVFNSSRSQREMLLIADHAHNNVACEPTEFWQPGL